MGISAGQIIIKGVQPVEEQKPQLVTQPVKNVVRRSGININNLVVKNKNIEETAVTDIKNIKKKKINILSQRNRTQIFNFDKSSPYMEHLLTSED